MNHEPEQTTPPYGLKEWWKNTADQLWHSATILTTVICHGSLFVLWLFADWSFGHAAEYFKTEGYHEYVVFGFRWVASLGVFSAAASPSVTDIAKFVGMVRKKFGEALGRTEPARPGEGEEDS